MEVKDIAESYILKHLRNMWGLESSAKLSLFSGGTESAAWLVEEQNGKRWVAKIFDSREDLIKIKDELNLYQFLTIHGINVPFLRTDIQNQALNLIEYGGYQFPIIVMRSENLRMCVPSTVTQEELTKIAGETAKMHRVLLEYPMSDFLRERQPDTDEIEAIGEPKSAYEALMQSANAQQFSQTQLEHFFQVDEKMEKFIKTLHPNLSLSETIIHADLALEHAQLLADGNVYFFDFADRYWGPVAQELATFMTMLYQWENITLQRWEEMQKWFLEGYQTITPLTTSDLNAIPQKMLIRILGATKYLAILTKNKRSEHVVNWIRRGYELGEHICSKDQDINSTENT